MKQVQVTSRKIPSKPRSQYQTGFSQSVTVGGGGEVDLSAYMLLSRWLENFEEKTDEQGTPYLLAKKPLASVGGLTAYSGGDILVPSIFDGLPLDNKTIWKNPETGLIEVKGGTGGGGDFNSAKMWELLLAATDEQINKSHLIDALNGYATQDWVTSKGYLTSSALNGYATQSWVKSQGYLTNSSLNGYATENWVTSLGYITQTNADSRYVNVSGDTMTGALSTPQINGGGGTLLIGNSSNKSYVKFQENVKQLNDKWSISNNGNAAFADVKIGTSKIKIYESNGILYVDGDLAVTGGLTAYAQGSRTPSTIMDGVAVDGTTIKKVNGVLVATGGSGGGGSTAWDDITGKPSWLTTSKPSVSYFTNDAGYITQSQLGDLYVKKAGDTMTGNLTINNGSSSKLTLWDSNAYLMQKSMSEIGGYGLYLYGTKGTYIQNKLYVSSDTYINGKVGIGTTSPSQELHIAGGALIEDSTFINCKSSTRYLFFIDNGDSSNYGGYVKYIAGNRLVLGTRSSAYTDVDALKIDEGSYDVKIAGGLFTNGFAVSTYMQLSSTYNVAIKTGVGNPYIGFYHSGNFWYVQGSNGYLYLGGTSSKAVRIDTSGNLYSPGSVTQSSDSRMKDLISDIDLNIQDIASMPTVRYKWKDYLKRDNDIHAGGIAQSVKTILPETITEKEGIMSMDYGTTAYIFSVQTARHLVKTDTEVEKLKKRVKELEKQLKQLGYEETDIISD